MNLHNLRRTDQRTGNRVLPDRAKQERPERDAVDQIERIDEGLRNLRSAQPGQLYPMDMNAGISSIFRRLINFEAWDNEMHIMLPSQRRKKRLEERPPGVPDTLVRGVRR